MGPNCFYSKIHNTILKEKIISKKFSTVLKMFYKLLFDSFLILEFYSPIVENSVYMIYQFLFNTNRKFRSL